MTQLDCLLQPIHIMFFEDKKICNLSQIDGHLYVLWTSPPEFGITKLSWREDGSFEQDFEYLVPLNLGKTSSITFQECLQLEDRLVIVVEERVPEETWGIHKYVISFQPKTLKCEVATERNSNGTLKFSTILSTATLKAPSLTHFEVILLYDEGLVKCAFDYTPYHLDDWVRVDDVQKIAVHPESYGDSLIRESRLRAQVTGKANRKNIEGLFFQLKKIGDELSVHCPKLDMHFNLLNLPEKVFQNKDIPKTCELQDVLREPKLKLPRSQRPQTVAWENKEGFVLTGKLSDLEVKFKQPTVADVIPELRLDGILFQSASGSLMCVFTLLFTKRLFGIIAIDAAPLKTAT